MTYTNGLPKGTVVMWYGNSSKIPDGWAICDGNHGTPDLRKRFIVGADDDEEEYKFYEENIAKGKNRGSAKVILTEGQMPKHKHSYTQFKSSGYAGSGQDKNHSYVHFHDTDESGINTNESGNNEPHENRPPYYALYFIMRII